MFLLLQSVSLGVTSFTLCALGIDRFYAATSSSLPNVRRVERCRSVLLKLLLVWLAALLLSSPEIFLWQLSQAVSPSTGQLLDSCTITPASSLSLYLPDSLHSLLLRYHQVRTSADLRKLTSAGFSHAITTAANIQTAVHSTRSCGTVGWG